MSNNKHNAKCSICGKEYTVCHSCAEQRSFTPWRVVTDTMEHYKIYCTIHGYTLNKDKKSAKADLGKCDLTGLENFNPEIKAVIKEIMAEEKNEKIVSKNVKKNIPEEVKRKAENDKENNL